MTKPTSILIDEDASVAIFGGGPFARAVAQLVTLTGRAVRVWARSPRDRAEISDLMPNAHVTDSIEDACDGSRFIVFAVPAAALVEVAEQYGDFARGDHVVLHGTRGFGPGCALAHEAIRSKTRVRLVAALGGPLYFDDIAAGRPLVAVVASRYAEAQQAVRAVTAGTPVRVHTTKDIVGVEVAGAVSNVTHLATGMSEALGLGDTARGILMTHGLADAERLGIRFGASLSTFSGLAGIADLIPRKVSSTERHHTVGAAIVGGASLKKALGGVEGCVEGVQSALLAAEHAERMNLNLPLVRAVADILEGKIEAEKALESVLARDIQIGTEAMRIGAR